MTVPPPLVLKVCANRNEAMVWLVSIQTLVKALTFVGPWSPNTTSLVELGTPLIQLAATAQLLLTLLAPFQTCADCSDSRTKFVTGLSLVSVPLAFKVKS